MSTRLTEADERVRRELGYLGARNHLESPRRYNLYDWRRLLLERKVRRRFRNHMPAREIKILGGDDVWSSYFKFCIERHPCDRLISHYYWRHRQEPRPTIAEYIRSGSVRGLKQRGIELYTIDGRVAVNRVCRYETLEREIEAVAERVGLPERPRLPRTKGSTRQDRRHYREVMTEVELDMVRELFADEIRLFGYEV